MRVDEESLTTERVKVLEHVVGVGHVQVIQDAEEIHDVMLTVGFNPD